MKIFLLLVSLNLFTVIIAYTLGKYKTLHSMNDKINKMQEEIKKCQDHKKELERIYKIHNYWDHYS